MDELRKTDQVAYIRFASVYREFADVEKFAEEIDALRKHSAHSSGRTIQIAIDGPSGAGKSTIAKGVAAKLGIERLTLKQRRMICVFPSDKESPYYQSDAFGRVIHYASWHPRDCKLRDEKFRSLLVYDIQTVEQALGVLQEMLKDDN